MTSLAEAENKNRIADVRFDDERMHVTLQDGREISVPLWWYPRLMHATPEQRSNWEILPFGDALHWPEIDEDLDVHGFLIGAKSPGAEPPHASPYTVPITTIRFTGRAMRRLDESEFLAICVLGSALNDLGFLKRAMLASAEFPEATTVERNVGCSQFLFFARLHLSKVHEALSVIDRIWRRLAARYEASLTTDAQLAVKSLMNYKKNDKSLANVIRNKFEFHFPIDCLRKSNSLQQFGESDCFSMYIHATRLNTFYFGSSMIIINYLLQELGYSMDESGLTKMMERFMDEGIDLDRKIHVLGEDLLSCIFDRIDKEIEPIEFEIRQVGGIDRNELKLPFFMNVNPIKDEGV